MPARPSQRDRLLRILRDAGSAGAHTHELRHEGFGNPSQRVRELTDLGHVIECKRERRGDANGSRYTLRSAGGAARPSIPSEDGARPSADHATAGGADERCSTERSVPHDGRPADPSLFEGDEPKRSSMYDPYESRAA